MAHRSPRRGPRCTGWATSSSPWPTRMCRPAILTTTSSDSWSTARTGSRWPRSTTTTTRSPSTGSAPDWQTHRSATVARFSKRRSGGSRASPWTRSTDWSSRASRRPRACSSLLASTRPARSIRRSAMAGSAATWLSSRRRRRVRSSSTSLRRPCGSMRPTSRSSSAAAPTSPTNSSSSAATWSTGRRIRRSTTTVFGSRRTP